MTGTLPILLFIRWKVLTRLLLVEAINSCWNRCDATRSSDDGSLSSFWMFGGIWNGWGQKWINWSVCEWQLMVSHLLGNFTDTNWRLANGAVKFLPIGLWLHWNIPEKNRLWFSENILFYLDSDFDFIVNIRAKKETIPSTYIERHNRCKPLFCIASEKNVRHVKTVWNRMYSEPIPNHQETIEVRFDSKLPFFADYSDYLMKLLID